MCIFQIRLTISQLGSIQISTSIIPQPAGLHWLPPPSPISSDQIKQLNPKEREQIIGNWWNSVLNQEDTPNLSVVYVAAGFSQGKSSEKCNWNASAVQDALLLCCKTTERRIYEEAIGAVKCKSRFAERVTDVLLISEDNYIAETCIANVAVFCDVQNKWITPRLRHILPWMESGHQDTPELDGEEPSPGLFLLPGCMRQKLLQDGHISEGMVALPTPVKETQEDLPKFSFPTEQIAVCFNSVRGCYPVRFVAV
jgi:hypothetical protein